MGAMTILQLVWDACKRWYDDNTFLHGAALAFYTVVSLAPLVLLTIAIAGLIFEEETARQRVTEELAALAGPGVADAFRRTTDTVSRSGSGLTATAVGVVLVLVGAGGVFAQLQEALNTVWGVKGRKDRGWFAVVRDRFWSFSMVLVIGFLLLVSLVVNAGLTAAAQWLEPQALPGGTAVWQGVNWLVSFGLVTVLFALIYKLLPDVEIAWGDVWVGALVTALLFNVGKYLIALYLGQSSLASVYGAAGSVVVILMWVYYSSQVLLLGAEFTYVFARRNGKPLVPRAEAEPVTDEARERVNAGQAGRQAREANAHQSAGV